MAHVYPCQVSSQFPPFPQTPISCVIIYLAQGQGPQEPREAPSLPRSRHKIEVKEETDRSCPTRHHPSACRTLSYVSHLLATPKGPTERQKHTFFAIHGIHPPVLNLAAQHRRRNRRQRTRRAHHLGTLSPQKHRTVQLAEPPPKHMVSPRITHLVVEAIVPLLPNKHAVSFQAPCPKLER